MATAVPAEDQIPWVLHPFLQFPMVFTLETFRRLIPPLDDAADHVQRWRRNRWYLSETVGSEPNSSRWRNSAGGWSTMCIRR